MDELQYPIPYSAPPGVKLMKAACPPNELARPGADEDAGSNPPQAVAVARELVLDGGRYLVG